MKIRYTIFYLFFLSAFLQAKTLPNIKKAGKSLVTISVYDQKDSLLCTTRGFFVDGQGKIVCDYESLKGAWGAKIIFSGNKDGSALRICNVNDTYDLAAFTSTVRPLSYLPTDTALVTENAELFILMMEKGKAVASSVKIINKEKTSKGFYYTLDIPYKEDYVNAPLINKDGAFIGIIQKNGHGKDSKLYAVSCHEVLDLQPSLLSIGKTAFRNIHICKQIPQNEKDATTYLFLLSKSKVDSLSFISALCDFVSLFPNNADGYMERAKFYAANNKFAACQEDIEKALIHASEKDKVHYCFSQIIYQKSLSGDSIATHQNGWDLTLALTQVDEAYKENPDPLYQLHQGHILFAMQKYMDAYKHYEAASKMLRSSSEAFFFMARAKAKASASNEEVVLLLDSALSKLERPYTSSSAPYFLERAKFLMLSSRHREALLDLNEYEHLIGYRNLNDRFYYMRGLAALSSNVFGQALEDFSRAVQLSPNNYIYNVEKAALLIRIGQFDEALIVAKKAIALAPEESDGYKMCGIAYGEKGQKKDCLEYLKKAKDLGDDQIDELVESYH